MMPMDNIQDFRSVGALNVSFSAQFACRLRSSQSGRTRDFQTERSFSMMQDFRQSSEAVALSQVSKMSRQLTPHYSSSKKINTHLPLFFRPDQGPHTTLILKAKKI